MILSSMLRQRSLLAVLAILATGSLQAKEELVEVSGREGAKVTTLITWDVDKKPSALAFLIPGGFGDYNFKQDADGKIGMVNPERLPNRLRPLLLEKGIASITVDRASDQSALPNNTQGWLKEEDFRRSEKHLADLQAALTLARTRFPGTPIMVLGHSNGTISAAQFAATSPAGVNGVMLIAGRLSYFSYTGDGLSKFSWDSIKVPLMLVHHRKDDCVATPYKAAADLVEKFPRFKLTTIGDEGSKAIGQCSYGGTHNLTGDESQVTETISTWIKTL